VLDSNSPTLHTCTLRPSGIFGPGDRTLIPGLYDVVRNGQTAFQVGDNSNLWDFTYVDNVAYAHILAAENLLTPEKDLESGSGAGETFLITNGEPVYFWDFARGVWAGFGHVNPKRIYMPMSLGYWAGLGSASALSHETDNTVPRLQLSYYGNSQDSRGFES
jgi:sterol-4alpha-carboxylate 3-dehydrogenase (decarboxylating)